MTKKKDKIKNCISCKHQINTSANSTYLKCPFCAELSHKSCAEKIDAIFNGFFYCPDHIRMKPANPVRSNRPERINTECQRIFQSVTAASKAIQSENPSGRVQLNAEQIERLSTSIAFINEILEQSSENQEQTNIRPPDIIAADPSATSTTINSSKPDEASGHSQDRIIRAPNFPPATLLPPPFTPNCQKCQLEIVSPFFKCLNCKQFWHDKCVTGHDRHMQISGYWVCTHCKARHDEHERIMNYCGEKSSILNEKHERQAEMYANMNLDDPFLSQPRLSQYPFRFPIPRSLTGAKPKEKNAPSGDIIQNKSSEKVSTKQDEILLEKIRIEKAIEELNQKKKQLDSQIKETETPLLASARPPTNCISLDSPSNSCHSLHDANITNQSEMDRRVEASIRRMNHKQEDSYELSRKLFEIQLRESQKKTYYTLPKVTKLGYEWKIFYTAFLDSHKIFTPNENVIRLQEAIQCPEIKKLGGINLFTSATYEKTLIEIDKRIGKPEKMLIREKQKLIGFSKLKNSETKEIVDFIEEVKAYATLVDKIGNFGDKNDQALIARLSRILPDRLMNAWTREYSKIKEETEEVLLADMSSWLDKQIDSFETCLLFKQMDPYGELKQKNVKQQVQPQKPKGKDYKNDKLFIHNTEETSSDDETITRISTMSHSTNGVNESPANYCWYHNRKGHSSLYCYTLLSKTGKDVQDLAKSKGICSICSNKFHNPCPQKEKFVCLIPDCPMKHATIFCPKRKCQKTISISKNPNARARNNSRNQNTEASLTHTIQQQSDENEINDALMSQTTFDALHQMSMRKDEDEYYDTAWMIREISMHANCQSNTQAASKTLSTSSSLVSVVTLKLESGGKTLKCAVLLDSGSTTSLLDEKYADMLQLKGPKKELKLSWSGGKKRVIEDSRIVKTNATGFHDAAKTYDIYFRTVKDLGMPPQILNAEEMRTKFSHLRHLPLISYSRIVGVIGTDQWRFFKQLKWIESSNKNLTECPVALLTPLGYSLIGTSCPLSKLHSHMNSIHIEECSLTHSIVKLSENEEEELMKMEQQAIGLDYKNPYENDRIIEEEQAAIKILAEKVKFLPKENRFEAPLLWKKQNISLATHDSFKTSFRRLKILLKNSIRTGKFEEIKEQIRNLITKGYARKLAQEEVQRENPRAFYIPIFISCPKGKRVRMIWDCAAKINGKSLNDYLFTGPNLYTDLTDIIIRFREGKYFVKSDIAEMFHQIKIVKEDCPALRFLFADTPDSPVEHYEMTRMVFGAACSPTTSQYVKNSIAKSYETSFPEASKAIINSMYVDDFMHSFNDLEYGKKLIYDAHKILKSGGFNLVKMRANHPAILQRVLQNLSSEEKMDPKLISTEDKEKLLGYLINYQNDTLSLIDFREKFSTSILDGTKVPTKKELLQFLMSIYDPLGFFAFFTSKIKLVYHWTCKDKLDWQEQLNEKQQPYWNKILKWLPEIMKMEIPRSYLHNVNVNPEGKLRFQLIIMGDAGKESLCTVAYVRILNEHGHQIGFQFVACKTYIVPLKQKRTIPELELDVACKCVLFQNLLIKAHTIQFNQIFYITDSSCVYSWIVNGANKPTVYVNNRLNKIRDFSSKAQWIWIQSDLQVADYGTKFESLPKLSIKNDWFQPNIFRLPEENWLNSKPPCDNTGEILLHEREIDPVVNINSNDGITKIRKFMSNLFGMIMSLLNSLPYFFVMLNMAKFLFSGILPTSLASSNSSQIFHQARNMELMNYDENNEMCNRFSSWNKLLRMVELVLRWKWKVKIRQAKQMKECDVDTLETYNSIKFQQEYAEMMIIKKAQRDCYLDEINQLLKGNRINQNNKLFRYNPFVDENGILRITTRLSPINNYSRDKISPIILPKQHPVTKLIIMNYHYNNHHAHYHTIIANLLQRFHISDISWTTKKVIKSHCFKCKKFNAKPDTPMMGDLPSYRLATHTDPFTYSIVDVCGPFSVTMNRRPQKRWLFVISCLTTRAIHIEILYSMTSHSCLMAFQNLINLRGAPLRVISDKGSNFLGASNILNAMESSWNLELKEKGVITQNIEWDFNPAKASHMSGSIERMIGLIKNVLRNLHDTLNKKLIIPGDEEFRCLICEIIGMLNNRPLTMLPIKDTNNCFLTPNHFLQLRSNFQSSPSNKSYNKCMIKEWQDVKALVNVLWDHFNKAYVNEILHRDKWIDYKKPLQVGDIVVVADPSINNLWRLGVIKDVQKGSKNQVRKVTVRLGKRSVINDHSSKNRNALLKDYQKESFTEITRPVSALAPLNLFVSDMYNPQDQ